MILISNDGLFKCWTIKRPTRSKAFHESTQSMATIGIESYICKGASTTPPSATLDQDANNNVPRSRTTISIITRWKSDKVGIFEFANTC